MSERVVFWAVVALFIFSNSVRGEKAPILVGSSIKTQDATSQAEIIFVGQVTDKGMIGDPTALGCHEYFHVSVSVLQILQLHGNLSRQIKVTLGTWLSERPPQVGHTYIFFAHRDNGRKVYLDPYGVFKLVAATDDNISAVKKLIAQLAKS